MGGAHSSRAQLCTESVRSHLSHAANQKQRRNKAEEPRNAAPLQARTLPASTFVRAHVRSASLSVQGGGQQTRGEKRRISIQGRRHGGDASSCRELQEASQETATKIKKPALKNLPSRRSQAPIRRKDRKKQRKREKEKKRREKFGPLRL